MTAYRLGREEIAREFEAKKRRAEEAADARRARLKEQDAEFRQICEEKEGYLEEILSAFTLSPEAAQERLATLKERHRALREREAEYLLSKGLSADHLEPKYECRDCSDTGYRSGGETCRCLKRALNALRARESGLFSLFDKQTFENFSTVHLSEGMRENVDFCKAYAEGFKPKNGANLLLVGGTGVGKTHLSSAIGRVVLEKGYSVVYEGAMNALSAMETERFSEQKPTTARLMECDLLILDDLGTELPGKGSVSFLYQLVNARLISGSPTILSTNLTEYELEARYEQRLFSRLTGEYEVLVFDGEDRRGQEL